MRCSTRRLGWSHRRCCCKPMLSAALLGCHWISLWFLLPATSNISQTPPTLTMSFVVCNRPLLHDSSSSVLMSTHHFARLAFDSPLVSTTPFTPQTVVVQNPGDRTSITLDFDDVDIRLKVFVFEGVEVLPSGGLRPDVIVNGSNELRSLPSVSTTSRTFQQSRFI